MRKMSRGRVGSRAAEKAAQEVVHVLSEEAPDRISAGERKKLAEHIESEVESMVCGRLQVIAREKREESR